MKRAKKIPPLYYYTTVEVMRFILTSANIYATNLEYMNDSEEYVNGLRELQKVINDQYGKGKKLITDQTLLDEMNVSSSSYSISFSTERDLLSQWSMYARESGVSLMMDFNGSRRYKAYKESSSENQREDITNLDLYPRQVYYFTETAMKDRKKCSAIRKHIIEDIEDNYDPISIADIEANAGKIWRETTPYVKRYEFNAEGEYRLVFNLMALKDRFRIDYRNDKHVLKPYLDIECDGGWPIREIVVGPGFNQQVVYKSIKHFMNFAKLKVPVLTGDEFKDRCYEYLHKDKRIPSEAKSYFNKLIKELSGDDEDERYLAFEKVVKDILADGSVLDDYKKYISGRFLSKSGIVLTKSEIPYIY